MSEPPVPDDGTLIAEPAPAPLGLDPADLDVPDAAWRRAARARRSS